MVRYSGVLRIGAWIQHPTHGAGRIANHNGTRYIVSFPGIGLREIDSHEHGVREIETPPQEDPIKRAMREILDEYGFGSTAKIGGRWEGGELIARPAKEGLKEHHFPVDQLFHKVVMVRDRLRVLEAKLNAHPSLSDAEKVEFQQYITRCYGSLTSFNFLFAEEDDKFRGQK